MRNFRWDWGGDKQGQRLVVNCEELTVGLSIGRGEWGSSQSCEGRGRGGAGFPLASEGTGIMAIGGDV